MDADYAKTRMFRRRLGMWCLLLAAALPALAQEAAKAGGEDISVDARKANDTIVVSATMTVPASRKEVWAVLTDYDHMAEFFSNLSSSKILGKKAGKLQVEQKGEVGVGPLRFPFESVREIELKPYEEIRSRAVSGTIKSGLAVTKLAERAGSTQITYRSESVPNVSVPFNLGMSSVREQTRAQFEGLRKEILRRKHGGKENKDKQESAS